MLRNITKRIIYSLFISSNIIIIFTFFIKPDLSKYLRIVNIFSNNQYLNKKLIGYPNYGMKYANINIANNILLPVYYGDDSNILKYGVGHYTGSYFPGENGTIIYLGHNNKNYLYNLKDIQIDDIITIDTNYGQFNYAVSIIKVVNKNDYNAFQIQHAKELLIIYTCYPFDQWFLPKEERLVIYAEKII